MPKLKGKLQNRDFVGVLGENEMVGVAESWRELWKWGVGGQRNCNQGRCRKVR